MSLTLYDKNESYPDVSYDRLYDYTKQKWEEPLMPKKEASEKDSSKDVVDDLASAVKVEGDVNWTTTTKTSIPAGIWDQIPDLTGNYSKTSSLEETPSPTPLKIKMPKKTTSVKDGNIFYSVGIDMVESKPPTRRMSITNPLVCSTCGSEEVAHLEWININDKKTKYRNLPINKELYCTVCQCSTKVIPKKHFDPNSKQEDEES